MKVSFVIPVFNAGTFLTEAIHSIRANSVKELEFEILLIDDCSTDPITQELLSKYGRQEEIHVLRQSKNGGPARARNTGIMNSTGEWIAFLDADDLIAPDTMKLRYDAIKNAPEIQWLAGDLLEIKKEGELTHTNLYPTLTKGAKQILAGIFELPNATSRLVGGFPLLLGTMMIRRNLLFQAGLFDETLIYGEDFLFALILSSHSNLYWVQKPCLYLRRYHESMTKNHLRAARENYKADLVALSNPRLKHVRKQLRWHISGVLRVASQVYLNNQLPFNAFISALKAIYWSPNDIRNYSILKSSVFHTNKKNQNND